MKTEVELLRMLATEVGRISRQAARPLTDEEWQRHLQRTTFSEELRLLLERMREQEARLDLPLTAEATLIQRPEMLDCDVVRFQNNKDKWIAFVGLYNGRPYEIFTGLADDEYGIALPKSVVSGRIIRRDEKDGTGHHCYDFQFVNTRGFKTTVEGLSYKFDKEFWNYARLISAILRHGMPLEQVIRIVSGMQVDSESIYSWTQGVVKALKRYVQDAEV